MKKQISVEVGSGEVLLTAAVSRRSKPGEAEQLVTVRPQVLSEAEHALGNLFQRIHHIVRVARDGLGVQADRLTGVLGELQELLELEFDYITPLELDLRPVASSRVVESLAAHLRPHCSSEVVVTPCTAAEVVADPRTLSRGFQLMTKARARELQAAASVTVAAAQDRSLDRIEITVSASGGYGAAGAGDGLAWQVAEHLVELQGGEISQTVAADSLTWRIALPLGSLET